MENEAEQINYTEVNDLNELIEEKERLATEGRYLEADELKAHINTLKKQSVQQKTLTLNDIQNKERQELDEAMMQEMKNVCDYWDEKINVFDGNCRALEEEAKSEQGKAMENLLEELNKTYKPMRYSREYMQCKTTEVNLAKQEKYRDAHYYKTRCEKMEKEEMEKYLRGRDDYFRLKCELLQQKQYNDLKLLRDRFKINMDLLKTQKDNETSKLRKKYQNRRNDLDDIHRQQKKISQNENLLKSRVIANTLSSTIRNSIKSNTSTGPKFGSGFEYHRYTHLSQQNRNSFRQKQGSNVKSNMSPEDNHPNNNEDYAENDNDKNKNKESIHDMDKEEQLNTKSSY